ncbi:hypothetical protein EDD15DRAFT_2200752 [Pisolithus albus]|nr:hypothetical protein EDD15DRAFT_2200752 [Pisolithus albus]
MTTTNDDAQPQPPSSPVTDPNRTRALLRELSVSMGIAPDSEEGLATLQAFIRSSSTSAHSTTPAPPLDPAAAVASPSDAPMEDAAPADTMHLFADDVSQPTVTSPTSAPEGAADPLVSPDVAMGEAPAPPSEEAAPTSLPNIVISLDLPQSDSSSGVPAPSPTPSDQSLSSTLTPTSSPARAQPPRSPTPERTEPIEPPAPTMPPPSAPTPSIPNDSPLASCAQLLDPRAGSRPDTEMEWRMFPPNCRLQYVPRDSEVGGSTVYPPVACSGCIEGKAVCSGALGIKCARCKARHSVCSHYHAYPLPFFQQDTFEGRARAKALITGRKLVGGQPSTEASVKSEPGPSRETRPRKRVRLLPPSSSSSPIPDDSPHPSTSRTSSTPDDSALATAFAIRDAVVAAVEAFDQTLEEHGLSSKAKGKRRKRD